MNTIKLTDAMVEMYRRDLFALSLAELAVMTKEQVDKYCKDFDVPNPLK